MKENNPQEFDIIEDSPFWYEELSKIGEEAGHQAVKEAFDSSITITYLEGSKIISEDKNGNRAVLASIENNRRKVNMGQKSKIL